MTASKLTEEKESLDTQLQKIFVVYFKDFFDYMSVYLCVGLCSCVPVPAETWNV